MVFALTLTVIKRHFRKMSVPRFDIATIFSKEFKAKIKTDNRFIYEFETNTINIDEATVKSFGKEWQAFHSFSEDEINKLGDEYFDIVNEQMINSDTTVLEVGCGSGRFLKYLSKKAKYIVGVDPSDAIYAADTLVGYNEHIYLIKASANNLPFVDESFDFVYSIGVLHHIPDTLKAMQACVNKVKHNGYFFTYLYYNLDNRGFLFKTFFHLSNLLRKAISKLPGGLKRFVCGLLAVILYMPFVGFCRLLKIIGVKESVRRKIPLYGYENKSFYIIRNDALDRFGTPLEKRFSKKEILEMMQSCGLDQITFSDNLPYWHAVGKKK